MLKHNEPLSFALIAIRFTKLISGLQYFISIPQGLLTRQLRPSANRNYLVSSFPILSIVFPLRCKLAGNFQMYSYNWAWNLIHMFLVSRVMELCSDKLELLPRQAKPNQSHKQCKGFPQTSQWCNLMVKNTSDPQTPYPALSLSHIVYNILRLSLIFVSVFVFPIIFLSVVKIELSVFICHFGSFLCHIHSAMEPTWWFFFLGCFIFLFLIFIWFPFTSFYCIAENVFQLISRMFDFIS